MPEDYLWTNSMDFSSRCRRWTKPCRTLLPPSPTDVLNATTGPSSTRPLRPPRLDFKRPRILRKKSSKHRHGTTHQKEKREKEEEKTERWYSPFSHSLGGSDRQGGRHGSCKCRSRSRCQTTSQEKGPHLHQRILDRTQRI